MDDFIFKKIEEDKYLSIGGIIGNRELASRFKILSEEDWGLYNEKYLDYYRKKIG